MTATAFTGGLVVSSLSPPRVGAHDVVVIDGRIADTDAAPEGATMVDATGCLLLPGNVCGHHHLYSALARGMPYRLAPPENFLQVLQRVWWRLDRALDPDGVAASAMAGGADALLSGTTTIVDHHASPNAIDGSLSLIADSLERLGVRSVLAYEVTDRDGPERARAGIDENRRFLGEERTLAKGLVGAHASFTLSPDTLDACVELAREAGSGLHIHVAEDGADEDDSERRFGKRVVHRLAEAGALSDHDLLAHCIHLDDGEIAAVRGSGAWTVHNPRSNMNNRVGHMRAGDFHRVALGTDGIGGDMFEETKAAFWRAREADAGVTPQFALDTLGTSARFAGRVLGEPLLGSLDPGALADLLVLEYAPPTPLVSDNLAGHWVFGLSSRMVRDVYVGGEPVVLGRRFTRVDKREVTARTAGQARRLWARMEEIDEHPFDPATGWGA